MDALGAAKSAEERETLLAANKALVTSEFLESLIAEADRLKKTGETDAAMNDFLASIEVARSLNDRHREAYAMNGVGEMYPYYGRVPHALEQLEKALALSRQNSDNDQIAESLANMGRVFYLQGNLKLAQERLSESVGSADRKETKMQPRPR